MSNQKYVMEPGSLRQRLFNGWAGCSNHGCVVVDPKPGMMGTNGICQCVVNASRSQLYMLQSRIQSLMAAPPAPPAPDVAGLVEQIIAEIGARQEQLIQSDYLMDSEDCIDVIREWFADHQKQETSHES